MPVLFGGARAEADEEMLEKAFVRTQDFEVLTNTRDFNFVVGRRGTGKSALFIKLIKYIRSNKSGYVFSYTPKDYEQLSIRGKLRELNVDYSIARSVTRVAWRVALLFEIISALQKHYKYKQLSCVEYLTLVSQQHDDIFALSCFNKVSAVIKKCSAGADHFEIPGNIAQVFQVERLNSEVERVVSEIGMPYFLLFDGLDDGWNPDPISTAVLGGLAVCVSDFRERNSEICCLLFFRDNIFRSLQYFDGDFSRHIEGSTLRLAWDESALFQLIAERLRVSLKESDVESDGRIWNKVVTGDLKNLNGFRSCLNYTLFRPRDIIVLLNETYAQVERSGRNQIIMADIELSSKQISKNRLNDLLKEYQDVFPGLSLLINAFSGAPAYQSYSDILYLLGETIAEAGYIDSAESDFAILGSASECFFALYSVGFLGLESDTSGSLHFCHDGSPAAIDAKKMSQRTCIHPCYWKALGVQSDVLQEDIRIDIYDDFKPLKADEINDQRMKRLGQIVAALPQMREGNDDASLFEEWVLNSIKILFSGKIKNPELHPNGDAIQRRDIIGTIVTSEGFWGRVSSDYGVRDIVFEVKNFSEMKIDNYRQALSYSGKNYGKLVVIVNRSAVEHLSNTEQGWVKEFWFGQDVLIFTLPAQFLSRCISKLRTIDRFDYVEDKLEKRLAQYKRSYLSIKHEKISKAKSSKRK